MFLRNIRKLFVKNSIYQYIAVSYFLIILIMIIPTIYSMCIWQYNRARYDKIIKNVGKANSILKVGSEDIPDELWILFRGAKTSGKAFIILCSLYLNRELMK